MYWAGIWYRNTTMSTLSHPQGTPRQNTKKHSEMDLDTCSTLILPRTRSPRVVIQEKSLQPLMKADLLNDEVINGALRLLEAAAGEEVYVFDPIAPKQFMQKKMAELPDTKFIMPMNIEGIHWVLGIRRPNEGIQIYDSLPGATLKASIRARFPDNDDEARIKICSPLKQRGEIDCGVFTIFTAFYDVLGFDLDHFKPPAPRGDGLPQPYDPDPKFWRQKLLLQLLKRRSNAKSQSGSSLVELDELEYPDDELYLLGQIRAVTRTRNIMREAVKRAEAIDKEKYPAARRDVLARFRDAEELCKRQEQLCHDAIRNINEKRKEETSLKRKRSFISPLSLIGLRNKQPPKDSMSPEAEHGREGEGRDEEQAELDDKERRGSDDKTDIMSVMSSTTALSHSRPSFDPGASMFGSHELRSVGVFGPRTRHRGKKKKAAVKERRYQRDS